MWILLLTGSPQAQYRILVEFPRFSHLEVIVLVFLTVRLLEENLEQLVQIIRKSVSHFLNMFELEYTSLEFIEVKATAIAGWTKNNSDSQVLNDDEERTMELKHGNDNWLAINHLPSFCLKIRSNFPFQPTTGTFTNSLAPYTLLYCF